MDRMYLLNRLQFNNDAIGNKQINPEPFVILMPIVDKRDGNLTIDIQAALLQFVIQGHLIYRLQ